MTEELSTRQVAAIRAAEELGQLLADEHPEIADDYRGSFTQEDIAEKYGLFEIAATQRIARQAVVVAIKNLITSDEERSALKERKMRENGERAHLEGTGVHGLVEEERKAFGQKAAKILEEKGLGIFALTPEQRSQHGKKLHKQGIGIHAMSEEERKAIGKKTFEEKKGVHALTSDDHAAHGHKAKEMKVGIHGLTPEQRSEHARKTMAEGKGLASITTEERVETGKKVHQARKGIHGLTSEEHRAHGRKAQEMKAGIHGLTPEQKKEAAQQALLARGETPWTEAEDLFCISLLENDNFHYMLGKRKCLDLEKIAEELNLQFHNGEKIRTKKSVSMFRYQRLPKYKAN